MSAFQTQLEIQKSRRSAGCRWLVHAGRLALVMILMGALAAPASADEVLAPDSPADLAAAKAPQMSPAEMRAFEERFEQRREAVARVHLKPYEPAISPVADPDTPPVAIYGERVSRRAPDDLFIGRNRRNATAGTAANSDIAEPAAINNLNQVLYAGNRSHVERSTNHGVSYTSFALPAGPADAPILCCDNDMAIDPVTRTGFHSYLYINAAQTNGVFRIFVKSPANLATTLCTYTFDPAGAANNIVPDYPHIAQSLNYVYVSINAESFARMYRIDKSRLINCQSLSFTVYDQPSTLVGLRVWTPATGGDNRTFMMWVQHDTPTQMRVFKWLETSAQPTFVVRNVGASVFANPDCGGGIGNFDFIELAPAWDIRGSRTRCTMASGVDQPTHVLDCYSPSAPMANRPQAFLRGTTFRLSDSVLVAENDLFSPNMCWSYPAMVSNTRGNVGLSLAGGGRAGAGGTAVRGWVGLKTPSGIETRLVAAGVANRSDGRFGDYFTIQRYQGCETFFGATSYAWDEAPVLNGSDVNARWVEFGRSGNEQCWADNQ
jgi:hypothetical protein